MDFKSYISDSTRTFTYRIKSVADILNREKAIGKFLTRYELISIGTISRTLIQKNPLDFPSVQNREEYILDIELGMPVSAYTLQRDLVGLLGLPGDYLIVRGENDPMEMQNDAANQLDQIDQKAEKGDLTKAPLLSTDASYPQADQGQPGSNYFGNTYNSEFLKHLQIANDERKEKQKVDAPAMLFSWLDMDKVKNDVESEDFNKDIKQPESQPMTKDAMNVANTGGFDDQGRAISKTYVDKVGKVKTLTGTPATPKKGK